MEDKPNTITLSVGTDTETPQVIELSPEGFFFNGRKITEDLELYEKFREIVDAMYIKYKADKLIA